MSKIKLEFTKVVEVTTVLVTNIIHLKHIESGLELRAPIKKKYEITFDNISYEGEASENELHRYLEETITDYITIRKTYAN